MTNESIFALNSNRNRYKTMFVDDKKYQAMMAVLDKVVETSKDN